MNFFNKLFKNSEEEAPEQDDGALSTVTKIGWKKLPLKVKLIIIGVIAGIFGLVLLVALLASLFQLESINSTEVAGSSRYDENTTNAYEQKTIDFQETNDITQYVDVDNKNITRHEAYYDSLFRGYEQYKSNSIVEQNFFQKIWNFLKNIFVSRDKKAAPIKINNNSNGYSGSDSGGNFNAPYGIQVDTSLFTTTLYSSRFYGDMILKAEMQKDKKSDEYVDFFLDSNSTEYYDLHSKSFRDVVEVDYFNKAREDEDVGVERDVTKLAIAGVEILGKYMIQRVETYYTLQQEFVGFDYDTTRHIKIIHKYNMSEQCYEYVETEVSPVLDHKRSSGGKYVWNDKDVDSEKERKIFNDCVDRYNLNIYDNAVYDNGGVSIGGYSGEYTTGFDELSYELDCSGYKEYLLGTYPKKDDIDMFCNGNCYSDNFIAAYYHNYVSNDEQKENKIKDIVDDIYSVLEYYENSTMNYNVCSNNYNDSSYFDIGCGNGFYFGGDCSFNNIMVELVDSSYSGHGLRNATPFKTVTMKDYIMGVVHAERDITDVAGNKAKEEKIRAMMVVAKSFALARGKYKTGENRIQIKSSNADQVYASITGNTYRIEGGTSGQKYNDYLDTGSGKPWKTPLSAADQKAYSDIYDSIANYVLIRNNLATIPVNWTVGPEHTDNTQKSWESYIDDGNSFSEALLRKYGAYKLVECDLSADNSYSLGSGFVGPSIIGTAERCSGYVDNATYNSVLAKKIVENSLSLIGKPYVRGDEFEIGQSGGDCSGLTTYVYNVSGVNLSRMTANSQYNKYKNVCVNKMMTGDILFWADGGGSTITHTGIYIGGITYGGKTYKNAIVDASSGNGRVVIRELWGTSNSSDYPLIAAARPYAK